MYQLPEAAGGGRVIVALLITDSRAEGPMVQFLEGVNRAVYKHAGALGCCFARCALTKRRAGVKLLPPHCTGDQDEATLNAECRAWNGMSFEETLQELKKRLSALADELWENGLLGVPLDTDNPPAIGLPIPGFQLNPGVYYCNSAPASLQLTTDHHGTDGTVVPLLAHDLMIPLLCTAHFINASIDYVEHNSVYFKHCSVKGASASLPTTMWHRACMIHYAAGRLGTHAPPCSSRSQRVALTHLYSQIVASISLCYSTWCIPRSRARSFSALSRTFFLESYCAEMSAILSLPSVRACVARCGTCNGSRR